MTYSFLQQYWWFVVSLLGALLVFLLFVQGANSLVHSLGQTNEGQRKVLESMGRKWEITFTTLVTFGGAFFASFPLFYSTSFGGAYWLWMIILFSFVLQAVSYEFQHRKGNLLGTRTYRWFLILNGIIGPLLLGCAVATFFNGSNFLIEKASLTNVAPHHKSLGQRIGWPRRPARPMELGARAGGDVPGTHAGHPLHHEQCGRRGHPLA